MHLFFFLFPFDSLQFVVTSLLTHVELPSILGTLKGCQSWSNYDTQAVRMTTKHDVSKFINFKFSAKFKFENHIVYWFMLLFTFFLLYVVSEPIVQNITLVEFPLFFFLHAKHYPNTLHHPSPHLDVGTLTHKHTQTFGLSFVFFMWNMW